MNAYSLDLRQRVIDLVLSGLSYPQVADLLAISPSTIKRYLRRYRTHGDLTPRPRPRPGRPPHKAAALDAGLLPQLQAQPDATLAEHCQTWQEQTGMAVSEATMRRAIRRAGWTVKKSRSSPVSVMKSSASPG